MRARPCQLPIDGRCFLAVAGLLLVPSSLSAQEPWTEERVVARALERAPWTELGRAEGDALRGEAEARGAWPNPEVSYTREQTFGLGETGEDYLTLGQTFDVAGRRGLRADASTLRARSIEDDTERARQEWIAAVRRRFYDVLHAALRRDALAAFRTRIDLALASVVEREAAGDASRYDRRRLERELALATLGVERGEAALEGVSAALGSLLGLDAPVAPSGSLLPEDDPPPIAALIASALRRPDLRALGVRASAADREAEAAWRGWIPDLFLALGWKGVDLGAGNRSDGFTVTATLQLPLFDRDEGAGHRAEAEGRAARARAALGAIEVEAEVRGLRAEAVRLRSAALAFAARSQEATSELPAIADAAYAGGELGILELLDAHRGATDDALAALELELDARRAAISLDLATGEGP